jgi:drug/metabolite transporter (DMT)-like permease
LPTKQSPSSELEIATGFALATTFQVGLLHSARNDSGVSEQEPKRKIFASSAFSAVGFSAAFLGRKVTGKAERVRGYLLVLGAGVLWGTLGLFGRALFAYGLDPLTVVAIRASVAFLVLLVLLLVLDRSLLVVPSRDYLFFGLYGLIAIGIFYGLYFHTIALTSVAVAAVLLYTAPVFVATMAWALYREPLGGLKITALALAFLGCLLVVKAYNLASLRLNHLSILTGLGSGFTYALYSIFGKKALKTYSPWTILVYTLGIGATSLLLVRWQAVLGLGAYPREAWLLLVALALGPTLLAFALYTNGLKLLPAGKAAIAATIEPVTAATLGAIVLGEHLAFPQFLGMASVIAAIALLQTGE